MFTVVYKSIVTGFTQLYDVVARKQQYQYGAMMLYTIMSLSSFNIYIFMLLLMLLDLLLKMIIMITAPTTKILIILRYFEEKNAVEEKFFILQREATGAVRNSI